MLRLKTKAGLAGAILALGFVAAASAQMDITPPPATAPPTGLVEELPPPGQSLPELRGTTATDPSQGPLDIGIPPPVPVTPEPGTEGIDQPPPEEGVGIEGITPVPVPDQPEMRDIARPDGLVAVLRGLDKITARVTVVDAPIGQEVTFGKLKIVAKYCHRRPPEQLPEVSAFLQIDDVRETDPAKARIFSGWMFASSPALHGVEHAVYDVWLIDCKTSTPASEFGTLPKEPSPKEDSTKKLR